MLETAKLQKIEREANKWVQQAIPNLEKVDIICPQMKRLLETTEEKDQLMGPDMEKIAKVSIPEKMSISSSMTTLTIDIQKILQSWTDFQHQLAVTAEAIVEVCVQKRPSTKNDYLDGQRNFGYLPVSSGRRNFLFVGEMLEEQFSKPT